MTYTYSPKGVCSQKIVIDVDDNIIKSIQFTGGCNGNLQGIAALAKGKNIDDVISSLRGIKCGYKNTSCPDQLACALEEIKAK